MTKEIQKLKKHLLMEELQRQGKIPKKRFWVSFGLLSLLLFCAGWYWYHANLQTRLEETFQKGLELRQAGQYADAVTLLLGLYEDYPAFHRVPQALYQAADIQELYLARYSDAIFTYLLLERDYPESPLIPSARKQTASLFKNRLNDCNQAIAVYQKVLDKPGRLNDQWQYEVADCYFRLNNFQQARIEFENLLTGYPHSSLAAEVQYRIAMTYALEDKLSEAAGSYRLVAEQWPQSPYALEARFGLATVLEEQEELLESLKILEDLAEVYPKKDILERKTKQVRDRIEKKKKAI